MKKEAFYVATSALIGLVLLFPLSMIFDKMEWPFFNGWALGHGTFLIAWPLLTVVSYVAIRKAEKKFG